MARKGLKGNLAGEGVGVQVVKGDVRLRAKAEVRINDLAAPPDEVDILAYLAPRSISERVLGSMWVQSPERQVELEL